MDARLASYIARAPRQHDRGGIDPLADTAPPTLPFSHQLRSTGLIWRFGALVGAHTIETGLLIAGWAFIGSGALSGRMDHAWLAGWALCLASAVPLRAGARWLEGILAVGFGGLLKQRLLAGAMAIDADVMRRKGAGELLGEVLEAEQIERLGVTGGIEIVLAALQLLAAISVLAAGAAAGLEITVLVAWSSLTVTLMVHNMRTRSAWTQLRFELTHRLVENMAAHRTRTAQQAPSEWHRQEDHYHERYAVSSEALDRSTARIEGAIPRGYIIAAVVALMPSVLDGGAPVARLAITFGGILLAAAAFERLGFAFDGAAAAWIAWRRTRPMFDVAQPGELPAVASAEADAAHCTTGVAADIPATPLTVLRVEAVAFTHEGRVAPVLEGCTLTLARGDFVLLEGGSGSGKSTLTSLLAGLRTPSAGVILADGLDRQTLGDATWRRRIALAPQYHENHILSASLGFNLLLGRPFPHSARDLDDARAVCDELGLGPLLQRMPGGLDQMVGETGWQLSQGERSRVFLARALLQDADVVLLDESLGALDPESLQQCVECVMRRARTLLVVAHP
jgi:ATP-binding cassette subfamily B protein